MSEENEPITVGAFLRQHVEQKRYSITQLAKLVGVRREHLGLILNDNHGLSVALAVELAKHLELDPHEILEVQSRRRVFDYLKRDNDAAPTHQGSSAGRYAKD